MGLPGTLDDIKSWPELLGKAGSWVRDRFWNVLVWVAALLGPQLLRFQEVVEAILDRTQVVLAIQQYGPHLSWLSLAALLIMRYRKVAKRFNARPAGAAEAPNAPDMGQAVVSQSTSHPGTPVNDAQHLPAVQGAPGKNPRAWTRIDGPGPSAYQEIRSSTLVQRHRPSVESRLERDIPEWEWRRREEELTSKYLGDFLAVHPNAVRQDRVYLPLLTSWIANETYDDNVRFRSTHQDDP